MAGRGRGGGEDLGIERGIVVCGGEAISTGEILDDLWVLDLTNVGSLVEPLGSLPLGSESPGTADKLCPWHEILPTGSAIGVDGGVMDGGMVFMPADRQFVLVGGVTEESGVRWTTDTVATLALDDLGDGAAGMAALSTLPESTADVRVDASKPDYGGPDCQGNQTQVCYDPDDCEVYWTQSYDQCDDQYTVPEDCLSSSGGSLYEGDVATGWSSACADGPFCRLGSAGNVVAASSPGHAGASVAYDPVSDDVRILGGYSGCEGGTCSDWSSGYVEGQQGAAADLVALLPKRDLILNPTSGSIEDGTASMSSLYSAASAWPDGASRGLGGTSIAPLGLAYDHLSRAWVRSGNALTAYAGGTVYRDVAILHQYDLPWETISTECASYTVRDTAGTWALTHSAAGLDDGIVDDVVGVGTISASSDHIWSPLEFPSTVPGSRRDAAVTAIDADRILIVGGQGGEGVDDILLVDTSSGAVSYIDETTNRYGATVSYDPIAGQALIFGGRNASSVTVVTVDDDPTRLNDGSTWEMGTSTVSLVQDSSDMDTWQVEQAFTVDHTCEDKAGGTRCGDSLGTLYLPTIAQADLETLDVELVYDDGLAVRPRVVDHGLADGADSIYVVELRLPRVVADGESLNVTVSYQAHADSRGTIGELRGDGSTRGLKTFEFGDDGSRGWVLDSLPSWWGTRQGWEESFYQKVEATWTVDPVGTPAVVGTGRLSHPETLPAQLTDGPRAKPIDHTVMVLEGVEYVGTAVVSGFDTEVQTFIDAGMDTDHRGVVDAYARGVLADDLTYLEGQLGAHPLGYDSVVYLRQPLSTTVSVGLSYDGYHVVSRVSAEGNAWADGADGDDPAVVWETTVHELAHAWWGSAVQFDSAQRWIQEAVPNLLTASRYPDAWVGSVSTDVGLVPIVEAMASGSELGLERSDATTTLIYDTSTYIVLQAWLLHMAGGGTDDAFWSTLRAVTSGLSYGDQLDADTIEGLLDGWAGFSGFTNTFVEPGALSIPMVAMTELELPTEASGDTGDTGGSGTPGSYTIQQVQGQMFGTASWPVAPYVLACSDADDATVVPLEECLLASPEAWIAAAGEPITPSLLEGERLDETPTPAAAAGVGLDVWWRMYTGPNLARYEDRVMFLVSTSTWYQPLLRCTDVSTRLVCLDDADSDGHVDLGDCDPGDPSVHPLWISDEEAPCGSSSTDHNCDGWTCPF